MKLELRPRQAATVAAVSAAFRAGHKRVMVYAPCGFGKTECAAAMLQACHQNGKYGSFIADRISLVTQTSERLDKYEIPHGVMQAQHWRYEPSQQIQVCSIQTLRRRRWPDGHLMVVDEAHVLPEAMRKKLELKDRYAIGLSATPLTKGLGKYFDVVVSAATTNELIAEGALVPPHVFSFAAPDMDGVSVVNGEWDEKQGEERVLKVVGDVVTNYLEHGGGEKFIAFAWNIAHALELQRQFIAAGINVATYTANDDPEDRHECVQEFRKPDSSIRGLISVEALTRGFDVADVGILIDCHPLRSSLSMYVQMLGRVMRAFEGKERALVFDHSGNCIHFWKQWQHLFEHGVDELDDGKRKEKGEAGDEKEEPAPIKCPKCGHMHKPRPSCPHCGHEYPKARVIEHEPGTLKEIVASGNTALMRKLLWPQVCGLVAEKKLDPEASQKRAQAIYKELTGAFAQARYENTIPVEPTAEVRSRVKANLIRYVKGKQAAQSRAAKQGVPA